MLEYVADFIRSVQSSLAVGVPDKLGLWFSRRGEGSIFLSGEEARGYSKAVSRMVKEYAKKDELSRRAIESYLQDSIFFALDLQSRDSRPFEVHLAGAMKDLDRRLKEPSRIFTSYVPIGGIATEGLPWTIGHTRLEVLNDCVLRRVARWNGTDFSGSSRASLQQTLAGLKETDSWGKPVAVVQVKAKDSHAADFLARREARRLVDLLNFFADLVPYNHSWTYLPSETAPEHMASVLLMPDGTVSIPLSLEGPVGEYSLKKLRESRQLAPALRKAHALKLNPEQSAVAATIIAAMEWAGRASAQPVREQGFLLFAVALETLMLPERHPAEVTYRLRVRVAHLLGTDKASRRKIFREVGHLYDVRSKIVHQGSYEVTDEDLGRLRWVAKASILHVLTHRRLSNLSKVEDFRDWFEMLVMR